jgi:hypothetical protein
VRRYLKKVYQENATILYELATEPLLQETLYYDFIGHLGEAKIRMPKQPSGQSNENYRAILSIGDDLRYTLLTFPPAEVEFRLTLPERPILRFAVGQMIPRCSGKGLFQVWIVSENGVKSRLYRRELDAEHRPQDVGWFQEEIDLASYANHRVDILFTVDFLGGGQCYWYLWADPVIMEHPNSVAIDLSKNTLLTTN